MAAGWAFAGEVWARHRWVWALLLAYLVGLAVVLNVVPAGTIRFEYGVPLSVPPACGLLILLAAFSHGSDADLAAAASGYPRRSFTLPLPTAALVGWPMALGAAAAALSWLALAGLVWRPLGVPVPLWWPALFCAGFLAWLQVLTWWPFPLPLLRILVAVPVLSGLVVAAIYGGSNAVPQPLLLAGSAALLPAAYALAVVGVARARRGDGAAWRWAPARPSPARAAPAAAPPFASPAAALFWIEWQRNGFVLPGMVGMISVTQLALLVVAGDTGEAARILCFLPAYPAFLAAMAGGTFGGVHPWSRGGVPIPAFVAARPVLTADLVVAKLRAAALSSLAACAVIVVLTLAALPFGEVAAVLRRLLEQLHTTQGVRGWALLALGAVAAPWLTWKTLANGLWVPLAGRRWPFFLFMAAGPVLLTAALLTAAWFVTAGYDVRAALLDALPWCVGLAVLLKLAAGALVLRALLRRRLISARTLTRLAVAWLAGAAALTGLAFWLTPPEVASPLVIAGGLVLVLLPLVRLGLAPLALDGNRHR
jgi:hypothetical protein